MQSRNVKKTLAGLSIASLLAASGVATDADAHCGVCPGDVSSGDDKAAVDTKTSCGSGSCGHATDKDVKDASACGSGSCGSSDVKDASSCGSVANK